MERIDHYQICRTGKLNQFYTLYILQRIIGKGLCLNNCYFVKNLSLDIDKSVTEVKEMISKQNHTCEIDIIETDKTEYCDLQAYSMNWRKTPKGFCADPTNQFWDIWRQHKVKLKSIGFSVFKPENQGFIVFFRNTTNEAMAESFAELEDMEVTISGNHLGEIKERLRSVQVTIIHAERKIGDYGDYSVYTFTDNEGNKLKTYYSGKHRYKKDQKLVLSATVKDHVINGGDKLTIITRMKVQHVTA